MREDRAAISRPKFGRQMRNKEFYMDSEKSFLNHGACGAIPKQIITAHSKHLFEIEKDPFGSYYISGRQSMWDESLSAVCNFVGADPKNTTFVPNTTTGFNNIIKSLTFSPGEGILSNNWNYDAMKHTVMEVGRMHPDIELYEIQHETPISSKDQILQQYRDMFDAHTKIKVAVIDHISNSPCLLFPVAELVQLCKERGVLSLIDGAHCIGHLQLNIEKLQPDFYCANLVKWMYAPRGAAIQWVAPRHHHLIRPVITTLEYDKPYPGDFFFQGCVDDTPFYTAMDAIQFFRWAGGWGAISDYNKQLLNDGVTMVTEAWDTPSYQIPPEMMPPYMRMVIVPNLPNYPKDKDSSAMHLGLDLINRFGVIVRVYLIQDEILVRVAVNIYCTIEDFRKLKDAILVLKDEEPTSLESSE